MRILGYALLIGGFLWLLENIHGFSRQQNAAVDNIIKTELFPFVRGGQIPSDRALGALWEARDQSRIRYSLLLPAYMMLAGGLVLGLRAGKRPTIQGINTSPPWPEIKSRVEEIRRDYSVALQPQKGGRLHRTLLNLMRRVLTNSSYFRDRAG